MNHVVQRFHFALLSLMNARVDFMIIFDSADKPPLWRHTAGPPSILRSERCQHALQDATLDSAKSRTADDINCEYRPDHIFGLIRQLLKHLGICTRDAPGDAAAECADLNARGQAEAVLTRDGDTFLFGAKTVLRVVEQEGETFWVQQFNMEDLRAAEPMPVERHHLLLLAIMHGSDYARGLDRMDSHVPVLLGHESYGSELAMLAQSNAAKPAITEWRMKLAKRVKSDHTKKLGH
jgi:5'-3' exonuclease